MIHCITAITKKLDVLLVLSDVSTTINQHFQNEIYVIPTYGLGPDRCTYILVDVHQARSSGTITAIMAQTHRIDLF